MLRRLVRAGSEQADEQQTGSGSTGSNYASQREEVGRRLLAADRSQIVVPCKGDKSPGLDKSLGDGELLSRPWWTSTTEVPSEPARTDALGLAV